MEVVIYITLCALRIILIWQMVEMLKHIRTPRNNSLATMGFLIYVGYLLLTTVAGIPENPESMLRVLGQILMFLAANRCFAVWEKKELKL